MIGKNYEEMPDQERDSSDGLGKNNWKPFVSAALDGLGFHRAHPEISLASHIKQYKVALGNTMSGRELIYLDQKYWIYLRDASLERAQKPIHVDLLSVLRELVRGGRALCPVSNPILAETLKQSDPETRSATARIIDELSENIAIEPWPVLDQLEMRHFFRSKLQSPETLYTRKQLAWTRPSLLRGMQVPVTGWMSTADNLVTQKAFFDSMALLPFSDFAQALARGQAPLSTPFDSAESQRARTVETRHHKGDFKTFKDVFRIEVAAALDDLRPELESVLQDIHQKRPNLADLLSQFSDEKITTELPCVHIMAGIHAAIRYRDQPHRKGDFYDHMHARSALPYCDIFLTERNLGNLLNQPPLNYGKAYECQILWDEESILSGLEDLRRTSAG